MISLNWSQVHTWRLSQHALLERGEPGDLLDIVGRVGGMHAQLTSAAELSLAARLDRFSTVVLQNALWRERSLIKTWAMRGTLHLLPASELPLYVAARSATPLHRPPSYFTYHGVTPDEYAAIVAGVPLVLNGEPQTREQLARALAQQAGNPKLSEVLLSGWGALLKPSAFQGHLCFGPNQGQNVTFVRPSDWIGSWEGRDPQHSLQEIARRYLRAYGPARAEDFARWWGFDAGPAKKLFRSLETELEPVDIQGWKALALASTLAEIQIATIPPSVRLLPQFDPYVVGLPRDCEAVLPKQFKGLVHRPQGWISAVVLVDGRIAGIWESKAQNGATLNVKLFDLPVDQIEAGIRQEAERLGQYWGSKVEPICEIAS